MDTYSDPTKPGNSRLGGDSPEMGTVGGGGGWGEQEAGAYF